MCCEPLGKLFARPILSSELAKNPGVLHFADSVQNDDSTFAWVPLEFQPERIHHAMNDSTFLDVRLRDQRDR
jgi:hypothetical protein